MTERWDCPSACTCDCARIEISRLQAQIKELQKRAAAAKVLSGMDCRAYVTMALDGDPEAIEAAGIAIHGRLPR